jgi:3-phytase
MNGTRCLLGLSIPVLLTVALAPGMSSCTGAEQPVAPDEEGAQALKPVVVTEPVGKDSDDPAIWLNPDDPLQSLILGTDKGGALYVFNLEGKIIPEKTVTGLSRMNNIDVEYGMMLAGEPTDIAVATDRDANLLRAYRLPDMVAIDNGGTPVFDNEPEQLRRPMGIALYKRPSDGVIFAVLSRKEGPSGAYLWQYRLDDDGSGNLRLTKVRELGAFSGTGEIEAVVVDDELGYIYYSDEGLGIHKYHADPDHPEAETELALFGTEGFKEDREGISIYKLDGGTGFILVSDQQANMFRIYRREGEPGNPHHHPEIKAVKVSTNESDGSEITSTSLGEQFPAGLFVAMSDNKTFHYYSWEDIAGDDLVNASQSTVPSD